MTGPGRRCPAAPEHGHLRGAEPHGHARRVKDGLKKLAATYDFAIHTHGSIGPSCAIAEFKDGKLTSWSAPQMTHSLQKQLSKMLALPVENPGAAVRNLDEPSREVVVAALSAADGVVSRAAQALGMSRQALYRRMERYAIPPSS